MASGILAAFVAVLVWGFIELFGSFYPSRPTWVRLRRTKGRRAVRKMRERFESAPAKRPARRLAFVLLVLVVAWALAAGALDKRWYEVVADAAPSLIVILALLRIPGAFGAVGQRMRKYEQSAGEDPDAPEEEEAGPSEIAL